MCMGMNIPTICEWVADDFAKNMFVGEDFEARNELLIYS